MCQTQRLRTDCPSGGRPLCDGRHHPVARREPLREKRQPDADVVSYHRAQRALQVEVDGRRGGEQVQQGPWIGHDRERVGNARQPIARRPLRIEPDEQLNGRRIIVHRQDPRRLIGAATGDGE